MDPSRIDQVLQFALAAAGREDDPRQRALGPIHLVKYVYLADLAYAETHGGETFTGAPWRFHHYGPWAAEVFQRIEPAAEAVGAARQTFPSRYDTDAVRYSVDSDVLFDRLAERALPWAVASAVRQAVHEHGADTESLLHHVYATPPMLRAAPGEALTFTPSRLEGPAAEPPPEPAPSTLEMRQASMSPKVGKAMPATQWSPGRVERERRRALAELRERVRARLAERLARRRAPVSPPPRYDEVFIEGTRQLDQLAGPRPPEGEAEAVFSDDIWKSPTRGGRDLP